MDYNKQLENPEFRNWVKSALGLKLTQQGLTGFIQKSMTYIHNNILVSLGITTNCGVCSTPNLLRCPTYGLCKVRNGSCSFHNLPTLQPKLCPNNICADIRKEIIRQHRYQNSVQWTNTDAIKWKSDYWEFAKCFLPYGYGATRNETEADLPGLLSLIINCKDINNYLTAKVDPGKNDLYHKLKGDTIRITNSDIEEVKAAKDVAIAKDQALKEIEKKIQDMEKKGQEMKRKTTSFIHTNIKKARIKIKEDKNKVVQEIGTLVKEAEVSTKRKATSLVQTNVKKARTEINDAKDTAVQTIRDERDVSDKYNTTKHIPKHTRDFFKRKLEMWQNQEKRYINTRASKAVEEAIHEFNCVAVTGASGAGKSSIIHHAALQLQEEGYEVIPCRPDSATDLMNFFNPKLKQAFVVDDWCGKATINRNRVTEWLEICEDISNQIIKHKNCCIDPEAKNVYACKLLISCRLNVIQDPQLSKLKHKIVERDFNVCSQELRLNRIEKCDMFFGYMDEQLQSYDIETCYEYFPLLCALAAETKAKGWLDIVKFFQQPLQYIYEDLDSFKLKDVSEYGNGKMCVISLIVMFELFDIKWLDTIDNVNSFVNLVDNPKLQQKSWQDFPGSPKNVEDLTRCVKLVIRKVCNECKIDLSSEIERYNLKSCFTLLEGTYVSRTGDSFSFLHDRIYDIASRVCGEFIPECLIELCSDEFIGSRFTFNNPQINSKEENGFKAIININKSLEEKYFQRLVNDLNSRSNKSFMINNQLNDNYYRDQFKDFIEKNSNEIKPKIRGSCIMKHWLSWIEKGYVDLLESLVKIGLESLILKESNARSSLLRLAIHYRNLDIAKMLLKNVDINIGSSSEYLKRISPYNDYWLNITCEKNLDQFTKLFVENGADVNYTFDHKLSTPFHILCENKTIDHEKLEMFLKHNADPNQCDKYKRTSFHNVCQNSKVNYEIIYLFLKHNAEPNQCDWQDITPFHGICENVNITAEMIKLFLKHSANPNHGSKQDITPFHNICCNNNVTVEMIELFLKHNADPNHGSKIGGTPFHYICYNDNVTIDMIELVLKHNADPNHCSKEDVTPFHNICNNNNVTVEMIELFLNHNADPNQCSKIGNTPFHRICGNTNVTFEMIELFLKHKANQCENVFNKTPYHNLLENDNTTGEMTQLLLKNSIEPK